MEHLRPEQPEAQSLQADREQRLQSHQEWVQEAERTFSQVAKVRTYREGPADACTGARGA